VLLLVPQLHDRNYVHRDVRVENAFVMMDGKVKLGDFGLSRRTTKNGAGMSRMQVDTAGPAVNMI
jgi:serine/threonine protein kinase